MKIGCHTEFFSVSPCDSFPPRRRNLGGNKKNPLVYFLKLQLFLHVSKDSPDSACEKKLFSMMFVTFSSACSSKEGFRVFTIFKIFVKFLQERSPFPKQKVLRKTKKPSFVTLGTREGDEYPAKSFHLTCRVG